MMRWLSALHAKTVIDVGAHHGSFCGLARSLFPDARIYAFEPLDECFESLRRGYGGDPNVVLFKAAVGANEGEGRIYHNEYSPSSSLLPMAAAHVQSFPFTARAREERVPIVMLDEALRGSPLSAPVLMKLDVQGYEREVMRGATRTLAATELLVIELSLEELYQGQALFHELYEALYSSGFVYRGNLDQLPSPIDGRVVQVDAVFHRARSVRP